MGIFAETWLTIDHQENVGKKREKRKYGTAQEKAAGAQLRRIHLEQKRKRAKNGRREGQHYLRERAAPGGRADASGSLRVRCCWVGDGVGELLDEILSEFHRLYRTYWQMPKLWRKSRSILPRVRYESDSSTKIELDRAELDAASSRALASGAWIKWILRARTAITFNCCFSHTLLSFFSFKIILCIILYYVLCFPLYFVFILYDWFLF